MSEAYFSSEAGLVSHISLEGALPASISVEGIGGLTTVIIDDIRTDQATNQQFNTSLAEAVYMYVFGDQMGITALSGKLFSASCDDGGKSGIEAMLDYYKANRASKRQAPIQISIGNTTLNGFMTRLVIHASGAGETNRVNNFTLQINTLPDDTTGDYV